MNGKTKDKKQMKFKKRRHISAIKIKENNLLFQLTKILKLYLKAF
jgi:hypothetical protein